MSLGIPAVVSPVGVNNSIVQHTQNGFIAHNNQDWLNYLSQLIQSAELRNKLGEAGRQTVVERFSKQSQIDNFLYLFQ